ncbi:acetate--CoA ligase family protein [Pararhizobium mangrovi]|uniref:ATP-grasp domain-containing protein n=1 Tax=Pararhizobium mangrovi TaxID=2590452 RepID=A0A506TYG8_9HYPH|nr:acetate--CoA ligase family protein [Pararhizobium mangrovi]TPW25764.1 hypothetical protein FJU11_17920 [Pararhizobium mangrovi]
MDVWGMGWDAERFAGILDKLVAAPEIDPIVFTLDIPASGAADGPMGVDMARTAAEYAGDKTVIFVANSAIAGVHGEIADICRKNDVPVLLGLAGAMRAIATWTRGKTTPVERDNRTQPDRTLSKDDIAAELNARIRFAEGTTVEEPDAAVEAATAFGFPVVMKGIAPNAVHKSDLGLVRVGLSDAQAVRDAFADIDGILRKSRETLGVGAIRVEAMVSDGLEVLVAGRFDPTFGPMIIVGAGGKLVEMIADSALRLGEVSVDEAAAMIAQTRLSTLLDGYRGDVAYDTEALCDAIVSVSALMARATADVKAVEINPLIVLKKGMGAIAVDMVIE